MQTWCKSVALIGVGLWLVLMMYLDRVNNEPWLIPTATGYILGFIAVFIGAMAWRVSPVAFFKSFVLNKLI